LGCSWCVYFCLMCHRYNSFENSLAPSIIAR
jgi:hypothetical protein